MGCFLACFGSSEVEKSRKRSKRVHTRGRRYHVSKPVLQGSPSSGNASEISPVSETRDKPEEQMSLSKRKKVTFDSTVRVYEPVLPLEEADLLLESEDGQKQEEKLAKYSDPIHPKPSSPVDNHVPSSFGTYPPNHRYQSCNDSNEEDEVLDYYADSDSDLDQTDDDDDTDDEGVGEEDDELSEDEGGEWKRGTSKMELSTEEIDSSSSIWTRELAEKESGMMEKNRHVRDRSTYVHPVLNPVENLSQWKALKARGAPNVKKPQKENSSGFKEVSTTRDLKSKTDQSSKFQQQMAVDASLSNWLISSETRR